MKIIGFNLAKTHFGLPLDNGGACLIVDGEVKMLINEERINRKQYSPGFHESIRYILRANNLKPNDIDYWVASSCLETKRTPEYVSVQLHSYGLKVPEEKILINDHHFSHACSAFYPSGFEDAIVMVLDGDGNIIGRQKKDTNEKNYWHNRTEHNSYYVAKGNDITLTDDDDITEGENGFGGAYRYFTYFCGFPGYKYAGKLMGLSAYGSQRDRFKKLHIFDLGEDGKISCSLKDTDRLNSALLVKEWFMSKGIQIEPQTIGAEITEDTEDAAYFIQKELDRALLHKVKFLIKKTGIKNLCIAGGVGLNAVTNRYLLDNTNLKNIFIQPASGDSGQCLGNAYYGCMMKDSKNLSHKPISVYKGREYSDAEIQKVLESKKEYIQYKKLPFDELSKKVAGMIAKDKIVGWFQGESEMGPRALGNRSLLADPRDKHMKDILNLRVKHREYFRPFAPSVLNENAHTWFDCPVEMPYMIMNAKVKKPMQLQAVTHHDGSARVQTVSKEQNYRYWSIISEFKKITGVPVVINTSFNDNEAIVETPEDALETFLRTGIDCLGIGDYYVEKRKGAQVKIAELDSITHDWATESSKTNTIQQIKNKVLNKKMLELVKENKPKGWVFDYHMDWGELANEISKAGYHVQAMHKSSSMVLNARERYKDPIYFTENEFQEIVPSLKSKFDVVVSNLWFAIVTNKDQKKLLANYKKLLKEDGIIVISFEHPAFSDDKESLVTRRTHPKGISYTKTYQYTKIIHENGLLIKDIHRPLEYYSNLFKKSGFVILDIKESETLQSNFNPDFIIFVLTKK